MVSGGFLGESVWQGLGEGARSLFLCLAIVLQVCNV